MPNEIKANFLESALALAERGFRVFPLIPRTKRPVRMAGDADHFDAATTDPEQIRDWAQQEPTANVALSPDENFCYLETDDLEALIAACEGVPIGAFETTTIGARKNRCYFVFRQTMRTRRAGNMTAKREGQENLFEFKQSRMYVTGPGSVHPKTGSLYEAEWKTIPAMPDVLLNRLCELFGVPKAAKSGSMNPDALEGTATLDRFLTTYEVATTGEWFNKQKQWYRPVECPWIAEHENDSGPSSTCVVYTEGGGYGFTCKHRCDGKTWKEFRAEVQSRFPDREFSFGGDPGPGVVLGKEPSQEPPKDWRSFYHSFDEMENAPELTFLIDGVMHVESITGLAAAVGQRKSLIALNIAHALCTGEPLFGHFEVKEKPKRVLYLCPEMGIRSFRKRLRAIGLMPYVGKTLFCRTMNKEDRRHLDDLTPEELDGAVVIVDTAVRFIEGDENSAQDMRVFADSVFRLVPHEGKPGAAAVLVLYHSGKGGKETTELTMENVLRGSGELGAALTCCWGTRLQEPEKTFESVSYLQCVKPRDFDKEPEPFEVRCEPSCRMLLVPCDGVVTLKTRARGNLGDKDGKDAAAEALIKANIELSGVKLSALLAEHDIKRSPDWVNRRKSKMTGSGVKLTSA